MKQQTEHPGQSHKQDHERYMNEALKQAKKSLKYNEIPIGAIVVDANGVIIGRGYNQVERKGDQRYHAEMTALGKAMKKRGNWRLDGLVLYSTLEPCQMCLGYALLSRVDKIIYGADSPVFGAMLTREHLPEGYKKETEGIGGLHEKKCSDMLRTFFEKVRREKKDLR